MLVNNKSINKGFLYEESGNYIFDYGLLNKGDNTDIEISISEGFEIYKINVSSSCGCTVPKIIILDEKEFELKINYNSNLLGSFYKKITVNYKSNDKQELLLIYIKGVVEPN
jgi:hypothetical protein